MLWKTVFVSLSALVGLLILLVISGHFRWQSETQALHDRLDQSQTPGPTGRVDFRELTDLPRPVQAYLRTVLTEGQPYIQSVALVHQGDFNRSETGEQWSPFTSRQIVHTSRPGFDWDARIGFLPGIPIRVHDAYVAGEGILHASIFGWISPVNQRDTTDLATGELMRYLAESAWYPTVLLPGHGITWRAIDNHSAEATLTDGNLEVSMVFRFSEDHLVRSVRSNGRSRMVAGETVKTPWEGHWEKYERHQGMLVPARGEVAWILNDAKRHPYWRGTLQRIDYRFAE